MVRRNIQVIVSAIVLFLAVVNYHGNTIASHWTLVCYGLLVIVCVKVVYRLTAGRIAISGQGIFITGCDTGFGHDLAHRLDELQFTVFAGCLIAEGDGAQRLKSTSSNRLHIVPLDVGSDRSVEQAHDYVKKHLPDEGLWAIVNNAGFNVMGDVELCTVDLYNKAWNVNFLGAIRTIRNFLYMVRANKGRVVIVTSVRGQIPWPADSAYHVTKHSLETMADSLRLEMQKFAVRVSVVEPGNYGSATACQNEQHFRRYEQEAGEMWRECSENVRPSYGKRYLDCMVEKQRANVAGGSTSTLPVIDALVDAIISKRPDTRYVVDGNPWFDSRAAMARYYGILPTWLSDLIITKMTRCDKFPWQQK